MKASAIDVTGPTSFLLKGPYGFGKTLAAASFAIGGPTYIAYWDKKKPVELVTYFKRFGAKGKKILDNIEYDVYGGHNANEYLQKIIALSQDCRYFAVITDSITMMTSGVVSWSSGFNDKGKHVGLKAENPQQIIPSWDEYKSETAIVSQSLDLSRTLPCHVIWTAHPLPSTKIEGSGSSMKVSKTISIVTYGSKVAGMVPGQFSEIYHFTQSNDYNTNTKRYIAETDAIGDDFAKTSLGLPRELDITNRLFYEVWLEALAEVKQAQKQKEQEDALKVENIESNVNPFQSQPDTITQSTVDKKWNASKGAYE